MNDQQGFFFLTKEIFLDDAAILLCIRDDTVFTMYSLAQKHCIKFSNEKSLVFLTVNLHEILHESTYTIYAYIYKAKKPAADGNPDL